MSNISANNLPTHYAEIGRWSIKQASVKERAGVVVVALITLPLSLVAVSLLRFAVTGTDQITMGGSDFIFGSLAGIVVGIALHELVHGVVFSAFHARPRFGFKAWTRFGPVFYAAAPGSYLSRSKYLAVGLSPALLLTAVLVVALAVVFALESDTGLLLSMLIWTFVLNIVGSAGDLVIATAILRYPATTYFEDNGEGFVAYGLAAVGETKQ